MEEAAEVDSEPKITGSRMDVVEEEEMPGQEVAAEEEEGLDSGEEAAVEHGVDLLEPETLAEATEVAVAVEAEALLIGGETRFG